MKYYPFNEGDDYYTIENGEVVESCWDDVSEDMHDYNPNKIYFKTKEEAESVLKNSNPMNNVISEYIEAVNNRSETVGDDRLSYAISCFYQTLKDLHLDHYHLNKLEEITLVMKEKVNEK